jgi:hypothetical protein
VDVGAAGTETLVVVVEPPQAVANTNTLNVINEIINPETLLIDKIYLLRISEMQASIAALLWR